MNYLDVVNFETYVAGCSKNSGVTVLWDDADSIPRTDGKTMWLPLITSASSAEWLTRMRYFVKHETSHIVYSDFSILNKYRPVGLLALINNVLEDHRVDCINDSLYSGDTITSNKFWVLYTGDIVTRTVSKDKELVKQQALTLPIFVWDATLRTWIGNARETRDTLAVLLDDDGFTRLNKLEAFTEELLTLRQDVSADVGEKVMDLAKRILAALYDEDPEKYVEKEDAAGSKGKAKGKGEKKSDGDSDGEDRLLTCKKLMEAIGHDHKPSRTGIHLVMDEPTYGAYTIPRPSDYVVVRFPALHPKVGRKGSAYFKPSVVNNYITSNATQLANKLRMKLQTRSRDRYEYGLKRGKLHTGSLHKLVTGEGEQSTRVFRKRIVSDTLDTVVTLLVDCSGSMGGNKFEMACAGAGAMAAALTPLNIKFSIYGFTNTDAVDDPIIWVFNDFGERVNQRDLVDRFKIASGSLWENTDGDALAYVAHQLSQRKEQRKVLLVLSDGSPAGRRRHGDISAYTKRVIADIEKSGIDIHGIGICDGNVADYYTNYEVVNKLDELAPAILSTLDRSI
jgi:hypothetical protein